MIEERLNYAHSALLRACGVMVMMLVKRRINKRYLDEVHNLMARARGELSQLEVELEQREKQDGEVSQEASGD